MYDIYDSMNESSINIDNNTQFPNYNLYNFNIITYEKDNTGHLNKVNNLPSYYLINKPELKKNNIEQDTKATSTKKNKESNEPELYTSNDILSIFNKESNKDIFRENLKKLKFS